MYTDVDLPESPAPLGSPPRASGWAPPRCLAYSLGNAPAFDRVWKQETSRLEYQEQMAQQRVLDLGAKLRELSELARKTQSDVVRRGYEAQMEETGRELEPLQRPVKKTDIAVPYRTAYEKSTGMLKSPITVWESVDVFEQHRLFFFLFEDKLPYHKTNGYWTADSLSSTRIFEELAIANSLDVDLPGIEPGTRQCECRVMPLYYKPY